MTRTARKRSISDIYHIVHRGAGRQIIFEDDGDRIAFLDGLASEFAKHDVKLLCWCLMSNHYHLLVQAPMENIAAAMRVSMGSYARRFNARHGRVGHLFQERFKSEPVNDEAYLLTVVRYIHQNPLRAGLSRDCRFKWSSFAAYAGEETVYPACSAKVSCDTDFVLQVFGSSGEFRRFHENLPDDEPCLDACQRRRSTLTLPDEDALALAANALGDMRVGDVKALPRAQRNAILATLHSAGLSVRQIERLTGIGRGVVQKAVNGQGKR